MKLHIREYQFIFDHIENGSDANKKQWFINTADEYSLIVECHGNNVAALGTPEKLYKFLYELSVHFDILLL